MKKWTILVAVVATAVSCTESSGPSKEATLPDLRMGVQQTIPGSYIITLRNDAGDVDKIAKDLEVKQSGKLKHLYKAALKGFAIENLSAAAALGIANDPRVLRVEADQVATAITTQSPATWGIDRIDQSL